MAYSQNYADILGSALNITYFLKRKKLCIGSLLSEYMANVKFELARLGGG